MENEEKTLDIPTGGETALNERTNERTNERQKLRSDMR